jgi:iron(III) transport system substrate-binding protein
VRNIDKNIPTKTIKNIAISYRIEYLTKTIGIKPKGTTMARYAFSPLVLAAVAVAAGTCAATAQGELNLYSSRHYDTDERLYTDFTEATGITVNRLEGNGDELIARMQAEGANSPADILITVDTSRLERAKELGVLQAVDSAVLEARIPANLQDTDNTWFGFSQRARIIFYDKNDVTEPPMDYVSLADPKYKGLVCHRSSTNVYSQTLLAAVIENHGEEAATAWAQGMVNNFAREPQGGDTDQIRALVSGECDIVVANTYYFARALRTDVDGVSGNIDQIGWIFPAQDAEGAHMNLSGAGVAANAPNRDNAVAFMEYLASDQAQQYFSAGNDEYPAVEGVALSESVAKLGEYKGDKVDLSAVAKNLATAQTIFNAVGWK